MNVNISPDDLQKISNKLIEDEEKRISVQEKREQKNKIIIFGIVIAILAILLTISIINSSTTNAYNNELRNMAIDEMDEHFTNVYADVVSIEPIYSAWHGSGSSWTEYTVCKCKTVEGKTVWVYMYYMDFPNWIKYQSENDSTPVTYSKTHPMRLSGRMDTSKDVADLFVKNEGDVFVLYVEEFTQQ